MLVTCLHLLKGTPYIYQGEEIGMTNIYYDDITYYRDIETINAYNVCTSNLGYAKEEMMKCIHARSRDNARTPPIQWDSTPNAGFSTGIPWIDVNDNFTKINVDIQIGGIQDQFMLFTKK